VATNPPTLERCPASAVAGKFARLSQLVAIVAGQEGGPSTPEGPDGPSRSCCRCRRRPSAGPSSSASRSLVDAHAAVWLRASMDGDRHRPRLPQDHLLGIRTFDEFDPLGRTGQAGRLPAAYLRTCVRYTGGRGRQAFLVGVVGGGCDLAPCSVTSRASGRPPFNAGDSFGQSPRTSATMFTPRR
jgi:hypothetical protein